MNQCLYCENFLNNSSFNDKHNNICMKCNLNIYNIYIEKMFFEDLDDNIQKILKLDNNISFDDLILWIIKIDKYDFYLYSDDVKNYKIILYSELINNKRNNIIINSEKTLKEYLVNKLNLEYINGYKLFNKIFKSSSFNNYINNIRTDNIDNILNDSY